MPLRRAILLCLAGSFSSPLLANQPAFLPESPLVSAPADNAQYVIKYQNARLPKWRFDIRMNSRSNPYVPTNLPRVDLLDLAAVSLSARRAVTSSSTQWVYATLRNTQYFLNPQAAALPITGHNATAAGVGWQFGEPYGFGLAVGYEFRYVGDENNNSLVMGVHYYF